MLFTFFLGQWMSLTQFYVAYILTISLYTMASQLKKTLRSEMRTILSQLSAAKISEQSTALTEHLFALPCYQESKILSIYVPMKHELQTYEIINHAIKTGKRVFIPKVTGPMPPDMVMIELNSPEQLASFPKSKWGIPEPPDDLASGGDAWAMELIDLVLLPGVSFNDSCRRLGHGKGYYDCYLDRLQSKRNKVGAPAAITVGLSLQEQIINTEIPMDEHDKFLDYVACPTTVYTLSGNRYDKA